MQMIEKLHQIRQLLAEVQELHKHNPLLRADDNEALEHHINHAIQAYERGIKP